MLGLVAFSVLLESFLADLATERERQLTTARANQTTGLTNGKATNWAPEAVFSPFRARLPKRNATMLDPFTQLLQHCWGLSRALHMVSNVLTRCTAGAKIVGRCCLCLHITANTNATTPNIVASVCAGLNISLLLQHMNYSQVKNYVTISLSEWLKAMI